MEQEFIQNQEIHRPREEQNDVKDSPTFVSTYSNFHEQSERAKVDDLRGTPMTVGSLEEIIDDNHAIISSSMGPEYYVSIMSFVNKDLLEPGSSVLLHNKVGSSDVYKADFKVILLVRSCRLWAFCLMMRIPW